MTDLHDVLDTAAGSSAAVAPEVVAADLRRGRRALVRRRYASTSAALLLTGAAVVTGIAVVPQLGGHDGVRGVLPAAQDAPNPGVDLVPFDGPLHGAAFRPAEIPVGWTVSGDDYSLLLSPPGSTTTNGDFTGKVVVYVDKGIPNEPLPEKAEVAVGDRTGYAIRADSSALQVWVPQADGTALRAQAPLALNWDEATLGRFLGAVTVSDAAVAGVG